MKSENINLYMGRIFEEICLEYMICLAKNQNLPFIPVKYGKWWGNNPARKMQDDIDVLLIDKSGVNFIICECKFKNEPFDKGDFETMLSRRSVFPFGERFYFYAFSKSGFSDWVYSNAANNDVKLLMPDDLFFMQSAAQ